MGSSYWSSCQSSEMRSKMICHMMYIHVVRYYFVESTLLNTQENISNLEVIYLFPVSVSLTQFYTQAKKTNNTSIQQTLLWWSCSSRPIAKHGWSPNHSLYCECVRWRKNMFTQPVCSQFLRKTLYTRDNSFVISNTYNYYTRQKPWITYYVK
jgi:hypothetical protein